MAICKKILPCRGWTFFFFFSFFGSFGDLGIGLGMPPRSGSQKGKFDMRCGLRTCMKRNVIHLARPAAVLGSCIG